MSTQVCAFNCGPFQVALTVRSGNKPYKFYAAGYSSSPQWIPQASDSMISWGGRNPAAGQLGFGSNPCALNDGFNLKAFNLVIPDSFRPTSSLQIYLFYGPSSSESDFVAVSYVLLSDGTLIGGSAAGFASEGAAEQPAVARQD